tara:strand:- start:44 stop:445 length:402 start_codon:yes stop_codon:yes gene_type:complete
MGEFSISRKQEQSRGIDIQAPHRYPTTAAQTGQSLKHRRPSLRIISRTDLANGLVKEQESCGRGRCDYSRDQPTIHLNAGGAFYLLPNLCKAAINGNATITDPALYLTPGPESHSGKDLLNPFSQIPKSRRPW